MELSPRLSWTFWLSRGSCLEAVSLALLNSSIPVPPAADVSLPGLSSVSHGRLQRLVPAGLPRFICLFVILGFRVPVKRFRITGKRQAGKRKRDASPVLPAPERWKRFVLPGSGEPRDSVDAPPHLFPRLGVDVYKPTPVDPLPQAKA